MASDLDTYTHLPLHFDGQTKAISAPTSKSRTLAAELEALNALHRSLLTVEGASGVPPPPLPVNPKRSANITKLRESGNGEVRKGRPAEAVKLYGLGLQMALGRPLWEPQGLVREEVAALYANRAQARMALQRWADAAVDAEASVEAKRVGNGKAWWRRGRCLLEMGRLDEAKEWVGRGLELEGDEGELAALAKEIEAKLQREKEKKKEAEK
ncbi:hypothetical protein MGN70_002585 [Eutypa lata]|uniref:Putative translocation protein sec72 protein n=1 Tax=Eutypa lata (strain UCR-EL1) TaxID=1287681 RepID=M7TL10_EUTLA|nr:putative translocation protein sec72 protein [Eutypa lata UCREL1]KAI1255845.1 hypothetical protein MGN70_002585 [Eutypa lata]